MTTTTVVPVRRRTQGFALIASIIVLGTLSLACSGAASAVAAPTASKSAPATLREFAAPPQYKLWWDMTRACSGLSRDVSAVRWFSSADTALRTSADGASGVVGEWSAAANSIQLVQGLTNDGTVVRHEMLHALIGASGHPADKFAGSCAGIVTCVGSCATSVGSTTVAPASAERISARELVVSQQLVPSRIDLSRDPDGWFALIVEARNPRAHAVWVRLAPFPGRSETAATFGYAALGASQQSYVSGDSISFLAGETKRMVFDLKAREYVAVYRTTSIRGFFNADTLPAQTLTIVE